MERIRQALEQAEKERSKLKQGTPNPVGTAGTVTELHPETPASAPAPAHSPDFQYKRTKIVDVGPDVLERNRLVTALPEHELTDAYRVLRTRVLQALNSNDWNALAITSPATGAGKTLTAVNLAISLAREVNRTVLLADFDLRHPGIHEYFEYDPPFGVSDYLFKGTPLQEILFSPSIDRLAVLPGRESIHNSSEMLRSPKMVSLVQELKGRYEDRLIIFDLPPVLAVDDALAFKPYTDAFLFVAENGATKRRDLEDSLKLLKGVPVIGTVLNKAERVRSGPSRKS